MSVRKLFQTATLGLWGGTIYYIIETLWRGYSHQSMFIVGGICFLLVGGINEFLPWRLGLIRQAVIGGAIITVVEFIAGVILNLWLGLGIWDYSSLPFNLLGQISLPFSLIWVLLSVIAILIDDYLRWKLFDEEKPRYTVFTRSP